MCDKYSIALLFLLVAGGAYAEPDYHIFVDTQGRSLEAQVIRYDEAHNQVTVKPKGRAATTVPISVFSSEDQEFIMEWSQNQAFLNENKLLVGFNRIKKKNTGEGKEYYDMSMKAYDHYFKIALENKSTCDLKDVTVEYVVFYTQDTWTGNRSAKEAKEGTKYAKTTITIPARSSEEINTDPLSLKTYRESGYGNVWVDLNSDMEGVIVTLSIKTKSGKTISRTHRYPDGFDRKWTTSSKDAQISGKI